MSADERVFWRSGSATVWVARQGADGTGALVFTGVDRDHLGGYEYTITVAEDQFAALRRALAADVDTDIVDLVCAHVDDIMSSGERSWLIDRGIEHEFSNY